MYRAIRTVLICCSLLMLAACGNLEPLDQVSRLSPATGSPEHLAMQSPSNPQRPDASGPSLWSMGRQSLLGDRRALLRGDILTVVVEINDRAEFSNSSNRNRSGAQSLEITSLLGLPQRLSPILPDGESFDDAVSLNSSSSSSGNGAISRNEKLTLRVAATIIDVLPNGIFRIRGSQEVRVNQEVRELLVEGYVRPEDISRQNEITYDKIASARISYGGRGLISEFQSPRPGQQITDRILPF